MLKEVALSKIKRDTKNPREFFDKKAIEDLAGTFKQQGVIHPIEIDENNIIICGERRWRAAKLAGFKTILCTIKKGLSPLDRLQRQYIENSQHRDLNIIEKGKSLRAMLKLKKNDFLKDRDAKHQSEYHAKGIKELADELQENAWLIREAVVMANEEKAITQAIEKDEISYTHISQANRLQDEKIKDKIKKKILANDFPSREILKDTVDIINEHPEYAKDLLTKKGDDLKDALGDLQEAEIIANQDLKQTSLAQAMPYIEEEYKSFHSTSLVNFINHLRKIT